MLVAPTSVAETEDNVSSCDEEDDSNEDIYGIDDKKVLGIGWFLSGIVIKKSWFMCMQLPAA